MNKAELDATGLDRQLAQMTQRAEAAERELNKVRAHLRAILDGFAGGIAAHVRESFAELVAFAKGGKD